MKNKFLQPWIRQACMLQHATQLLIIIFKKLNWSDYLIEKVSLSFNCPISTIKYFASTCDVLQRAIRRSLDPGALRGSSRRLASEPRGMGMDSHLNLMLTLALGQIQATTKSPEKTTSSRRTRMLMIMRCLHAAVCLLFMFIEQNYSALLKLLG